MKREKEKTKHISRTERKKPTRVTGIRREQKEKIYVKEKRE